MIGWLKALLPAIASSRVALVPEGWCLVREKPTEAHIESMCMRFDHSHGIKHSFPVEESDAHFEARRNFNRTMVLQLYEEATGQGFFKLDPYEPEPEPDWMEPRDLVRFHRQGGISPNLIRPAGLEADNPNLSDCELIDGLYYAPCKTCGSLVEVDDPESFAPEHNYCGRSLRCCP